MAVKIELDVQEGGGEPATTQGRGDGSNGTYVYYLGMVVVVIGFVSCVMQLQFHDDNCSVDISDGSWIEGKWHSHHCMMHYFTTLELGPCLAKRPRIALIGGSAMDYYRQTLGELQAEIQQSKAATKITIETLRLTDDKDVAAVYKKLATELSDGPALLVLQKLEKSLSEDDEKCRATVKQLIAAQETLLEAGGVTGVDDSPLIVTLLTDVDGNCLEFAQELYANSSLSHVHLPSPPDDTTDDFLSHELNMVLNLYCNSPANATCCVPTLTGTLASYFYLDASFLLLILALYLGIWLVFATGATFALSPYLEAMSCNLERFFTILHCIGGMCTVLFYMLLADRLDYFTRVSKFSNPVLFALIMVGVLIASAATITRRKKKEYFARDQINEWRGWMVIFLIAVNYTNMDEVIWIHVVGRLLVGGFLFLSGYTHFMYFWNSGYVSWKRVLHVLLELNFIPLCVCLSLGSSYGAYYLVALLLVNFLFTASFVAVWPSIDTIKQNKLGIPFVVFLIKFAVAFVLVSYLLPLTKELLASTPLRMFLQSFDDCPYALYNWFYQLRYMTMFGMIVAVIRAQLKDDFVGVVSYSMNGFTIYAAIAIAGYVVFLAKCNDKDTCIRTQTYIAILPFLAYIFLRNSFKRLQYYYSSFLSRAGSLSVWLFVSHFHLLLARDGKGLLMLIPRFHYLNILAVVTVYVFFFFVVQKSVSTLKSWLRESKSTRVGTDSSLLI